jgi:hypothetical protein
MHTFFGLLALLMLFCAALTASFGSLWFIPLAVLCVASVYGMAITDPSRHK